MSRSALPQPHPTRIAGLGDRPGPEALLISNYRLMAVRIAAALDGSLVVANSRQPTSPPSCAGIVVGLCGQGGRHPYFSLPEEVLRGAALAIMNLGQDQANVRDDVDQLLGLCAGLRYRTVFTESSGCINDTHPQMVALLSPEEVWCNDRELPLDVWKLISCEYDLVTLTTMSQSSLGSSVPTTLNSAAFAFADAMRRIGRRMASFRVVRRNFTAGCIAVSRPGPAIEEIHVPLRQLFFEAGGLLTPLHRDPTTQSTIAPWFTALRYLHWLADDSNDLRVKKDFKGQTVDARYRGVFAEEMAIGVMAVVVQDLFGVTRISNMAERFDLRGHSGLVADFLALGRNAASGGTTGFIIESKGSLGTSVSSYRQKHAMKQVAASGSFVIPTITSSVGVTCCTSIRFSQQRKVSECLVTDPDIEEQPPAEFSSGDLWRDAYSKLLRFIGLESAALQVASAKPAYSLGLDYADRFFSLSDNSSPPTNEAIHGRRSYVQDRYHADYVLDVGDSGVAIDLEVLQALQQGLDDNRIVQLEHYLFERRARFQLGRPTHQVGVDDSSFINGLGVGLVDYPSGPS
jgi:hypothetical protein